MGFRSWTCDGGSATESVAFCDTLISFSRFDESQERSGRNEVRAGLGMIDRGELQCCNQSLPVVGKPAMGPGSTQHVVVSFETPAVVRLTPLDVRSQLRNQQVEGRQRRDVDDRRR